MNWTERNYQYRAEAARFMNLLRNLLADPRRLMI